MKPYNELTHRGRLRRMRRLAEAALEEYGLGGACLKFYLQAGNTLYRVYDPNTESAQPGGDLFEPGQYLLRIYQPGWQTTEAIELELAWLAAMRREAGLPVPEPIPRQDGGLLTQIGNLGQIHQDVVAVKSQQRVSVEHERADRADKHHAQRDLVQQAHLAEPPDIRGNRGQKHFDVHSRCAEEGTFPLAGQHPRIGNVAVQAWCKHQEHEPDFVALTPIMLTG